MVGLWLAVLVNVEFIFTIWVAVSLDSICHWIAYLQQLRIRSLIIWSHPCRSITGGLPGDSFVSPLNFRKKDIQLSRILTKHNRHWVRIWHILVLVQCFLKQSPLGHTLQMRPGLNLNNSRPIQNCTRNLWRCNAHPTHSSLRNLFYCDFRQWMPPSVLEEKLKHQKNVSYGKKTIV